MINIGLFYEDIPNRNPSEKIFTDIFFENFNTKIFNASKIKNKKYLENYLQLNDIYILHFYSFLYHDKFAPKKIDIKYFPENFKKIILAHKKILPLLLETKKPIIIMFVRSDWYSHGQNFWENIPENAYLFGGFKKGYLNTNASDEFIFKKFGSNIELGNEFIEDYKILPFHHVVDKNELKFCNKFNQKKYDIAILGVLYKRRKYLYEILKNKKNIKLYDQWLLLKLRKIFNSFDKKKYKFNHKILSYLFKKAICNSKISYTDGSELDMFVRKFIEIPALKSLLYCDPFKNMKDYGFIENIHYIKVDQKNIEEQIYYLLKDSDKIQKITYNGYNLILKNFSKNAYKKNIEKVFGLISQDKFKEAFWNNGKLHILEKK
ncbi:hypothetical protein [Nitrosophilus kaiyonis]|uniref:hypothetical protein n=1 Tax=Nitrosophilus kaiyonis TaxID=2930200 RepID=UPI00249298A0|nr:hypothetical protein [Nitrosophilus kaiyonis]